MKDRIIKDVKGKPVYPVVPVNAIKRDLIIDRIAAASKKARALLAILILYISSFGQSINTQDFVGLGNLLNWYDSVVVVNSVTIKYSIDNIRLKFYSTLNTGKFEDINKVDIENDTLYEFSKLQYVYEIQENNFVLLTDIWNVLKQNGFTLTTLVKPSYNKAVSEHTKFNTAHTALYSVTGSSLTAIINLYKNYMIRSVQCDNLRNIIEMININGFKIKPENNSNFEAAVKAYEDYHKQIKL